MNLLSHFPSSQTRRLPWIESLLAIALVTAAWVYGFSQPRASVEDLISNVLLGTQIVEKNNSVFTAYDDAGEVLGYAAAAEATGYGGPVYLLVGVDVSGEIAGVQVVEQRETPGFYALLRDGDFFQNFLGHQAASQFVVGENVDGISGATLSSRAVAQAINLSAAKIHSGALADTAQPIRFGFPEIILLVLFAGALSLRRFRWRQFRKAVQWGVLIVSMITLGFMLNQPLTIANFGSLLAGYWPAWQEHLYWYMMLAGVLILTLTENNNIYCRYICPFGAVQECFGAMGNAKPNLPPGIYRQLQWVPRWLAVLALSLGLAFRQPGAASFEPFGTLFSLSSGFFPWMLLVFVLFASMLITRPFCYYLCPVRPVIDFILFVRRQFGKLWITKNS